MMPRCPEALSQSRVSQEIVKSVLAHLVHFMVFPIKSFCPPSKTKCIYSELPTPGRNHRLAVIK